MSPNFKILKSKKVWNKYKLGKVKLTKYCTFPIYKLPEIMYDVSQSHSASDRISEANKLPAFGVEKSCFLIAKGTT